MDTSKKRVRSNLVDEISDLLNGISSENLLSEAKKQAEQLQCELADSLKDMSKKKSELEENRHLFENLGDASDSIEKLSVPLSEHMKTLRLNEGSLAGNAAVLEYDNAKNRASKLNKCISARRQFEYARETLKDASKDDKQAMFSCLQDLQNSIDTINEYVPNAKTDSHEVEELKDSFLAWKSTELTMAIHQADHEKLSDIYKTYVILDRKEEFIKVFGQVSCNRIKETKLASNNFGSLLEGIFKEVEFAFDHHFRVLSVFLSDDECNSLLSSGIRQGLTQLNIDDVIGDITNNVDNPVTLLMSLGQTLGSLSARVSNHDHASCLEEILNDLRSKMQETLLQPLKSMFTNHALAKINTLELTTGSHRSRVESLRHTVADLIVYLHEIVSECAKLYPDNTRATLQQPIDTSIDNLLAKLKSWDFSTDSQGKCRNLPDFMQVCGTSGQLAVGMSKLKQLIETLDPGLSPDTRSVAKWNSRVCDKTLQCAANEVTGKMKTSIQNVKASPIESIPADLPTFSISPSEYVTTVGQDLLHLFHRFEQSFADDNVADAFYFWAKKKFEGEELFKKVMSDIASLIVDQFVKSVGAEDAPTLPPQHAKQLFVDANFLKDALDDLRVGKTEALSSLSDSLQKAFKK